MDRTTIPHLLTIKQQCICIARKIVYNVAIYKYSSKNYIVVHAKFDASLVK